MDVEVDIPALCSRRGFRHSATRLSRKKFCTLASTDLEDVGFWGDHLDVVGLHDLESPHGRPVLLLVSFSSASPSSSSPWKA